MGCLCPVKSLVYRPGQCLGPEVLDQAARTIKSGIINHSIPDARLAMPRATRFGVIGGGALGGLYGALLAKAAFDVHFLLRSDAGHVRHHGWKVETPLGDFDVPVVNVHTSVETMPACDVTVVALKTTQNAILQSLLPKPTSQGGCVLVLQNGLDVERDAAVVVGPERVLGGCCFLCSNKVKWFSPRSVN